jgi:hypothetical protein
MSAFWLEPALASATPCPTSEWRFEGTPPLGARLLARQGIQNLVRVQSTSPEGAADDSPVLMARLNANDGESAVGRVEAALEGEPFTVRTPGKSRASSARDTARAMSQE